MDYKNWSLINLKIANEKATWFLMLYFSRWCWRGNMQ